MAISKQDFIDLTTHIDNTVGKVQKQVDKNQQHITKLFQRTEDNRVATTEAKGQVKTTNETIKGIEKSAKTAKWVIGTMIAILTLAVAFVGVVITVKGGTHEKDRNTNPDHCTIRDDH